MFQYIVLMMVCLLMSSCGKKGAVEPLEQSDYPRPYPKPQKPEPLIMKKQKKVDYP